MTIKHSAHTLLALIYRPTKTECRQYPFHNLTDIEKFCQRHPYKSEILTAIIYEDRREIGRITCHAQDIPSRIARRMFSS